MLGQQIQRGAHVFIRFQFEVHFPSVAKEKFAASQALMLPCGDNLQTITLFNAQPAKAGTPCPEVSDSLDPPNRLSIALRIAMSLALAGISPYE